MTQQSPQFISGDLFARHRTIAGLRALADFLETSPNVPITELGEDYRIFVQTDNDACGRDLVDQVAALLEASVRDNTERGGHYTASRNFGPISYEVIYIPDRARARYDAQLSYVKNIVLDDQDGRAA